MVGRNAGPRTSDTLGVLKNTEKLRFSQSFFSSVYVFSVASEVFPFERHHCNKSVFLLQNQKTPTGTMQLALLGAASFLVAPVAGEASLHSEAASQTHAVKASHLLGRGKKRLE